MFRDFAALPHGQEWFLALFWGVLTHFCDFWNFVSFSQPDTATKLHWYFDWLLLEIWQKLKILDGFPTKTSQNISDVLRPYPGVKNSQNFKNRQNGLKQLKSILQTIISHEGVLQSTLPSLSCNPILADFWGSWVHICCTRLYCKPPPRGFTHVRI